MIKKIIAKWKAEWLNKNELKLAIEFESQLEELKSTLKGSIADQEAMLISITNSFKTKQQELIFNQNEVEELSRRCDAKKIELIRLNEELLVQIRIAEGKLSPEGVWAQAFTSGFNKAWDMMALMNDGYDHLKKLIRDEAISETLGQRNGHKKIN